MVAALARSTNGNGRGAASLIGALVGGVAGNEVDQWVRAGRNVDAVTRPDDSRSTEARRIDSPVIDPGERVRIVEAATGIK
jgi:outer membrane lipoprotein SlyB